MKIVKVLFSEECIAHHHVVEHEFLETPHFFEYDEATKIIDLFRYLLIMYN